MELNPEMLVQRSGTLSLLSANAEEATRLVDRTECNIAQVVRVIERDRRLTDRLLELINSPMFGFPTAISSVGRAIAIIGPRDLGDLTVAAAVANAFERFAHGSDSPTRHFWERALYGAVTARLLAEYRHENHPERFFVAGLLHDIGSVVLQLAVPNLYAQSIKFARRRGLEQHQAERQLIGIDHSAVGGALARGWGLSDCLTAAIADHHAPCVSRYPLEASAAHVANHMADEALAAGAAGRAAVDRQVWDLIGVTPTKLDADRAEIDRRVADVRHSLLAQTQAA